MKFGCGRGGQNNPFTYVYGNGNKNLYFLNEMTNKKRGLLLVLAFEKIHHQLAAEFDLPTFEELQDLLDGNEDMTQLKNELLGDGDSGFVTIIESVLDFELH